MDATRTKSSLVVAMKNSSSQSAPQNLSKQLAETPAGTLTQSDLRQIVSELAMHSCAYEAVRAMLYASVDCVMDVKQALCGAPLKETCIRRQATDIIAHKLTECREQFLRGTDFRSLANFYAVTIAEIALQARYFASHNELYDMVDHSLTVLESRRLA